MSLLLTMKNLLYDCKNNHVTENISLNKFNDLQNINENDIKCYYCNNTKFNSYNKEFYRCLRCKINLCPLCNDKHNKSHDIINYNNINYVCFFHNDFYVSYCKNCKINLCMKCEINHNNAHLIINFKNIFPDEYEIKEELESFKIKINLLKITIEKMISILNDTYEAIENQYKIINDIFLNFNIRHKNYEILTNVNSIKNFIKLIDIDIDNIINQDNNYKIIYDVYQKRVNDKNNENINVFFEHFDKTVNLRLDKNTMFAEAALKFLKHIKLRIPIFLYNSQSIRADSMRTLSELGLRTGAKIKVIDGYGIRGGAFQIN